MLDIVILTVALFVLGVGTITDFQRREVPDWLNYFLIASGLGLSLIKALAQSDVLFFALSVAGALAGYGFGYIMVKSGQWGGGDAKNLIGLGACFGSFTPLFSPNLLISIPYNYHFLGVLMINILICGAAYGVVWTIVESVLNWRKVIVHVKAYLQKFVFTKYAMLFTCIVLLICAALFSQLRVILAFLALAIFGLACVMLLVKIVESKLHIFPMSLQKMTPGEWVYEDTYVARSSKSLKTHLCELHKNEYIEWEDQSFRARLAKIGLPFMSNTYKSYVKPTTQELLHIIMTDCQVSTQQANTLLNSTKTTKKLIEQFHYYPTKEYITGPDCNGITQQQIDRLKKAQYKSLVVKIGIPFIPAFLIGFVVTITYGSLFAILTSQFIF